MGVDRERARGCIVGDDGHRAIESRRSAAIARSRSRRRRRPCASRSARCRASIVPHAHPVAPRAGSTILSGSVLEPRAHDVRVAPCRDRRCRASARPARRRVRRARTWSSARRSTIVSSATIPAAAITPAWRMPPPSRARSLAGRRRSRRAGPHSNDPTGAPSPFDRQNITVSHRRDQRQAVTSRARPPRSRCAPRRSAPRRRRRAVPRRHRVDLGGVATAARTPACACSRSRPARPAAGDGRLGRPRPRRQPAEIDAAGIGERSHLHAAFDAAPPQPRSGTRARARHRAPRCPGDASTRIASWFAIVPDGT